VNLKPYERVVEFSSKQMFDDLSKRKEIIDQGRALSKEIEGKNAELAKLQEKLKKADDRVRGYVVSKFKPLLKFTEDTREVMLQDGKVILVIYDRVEEFRLNLEKAHRDALDEAPEEAKKS
jgi:hypothetical protein